jgi:hypothetical protein
VGRGEGVGGGGGGGRTEGLLDILDPRIKEKKVAEPQIFITFSNRISISKNRFFVSRETVSGHARECKSKCEK